VFPTVKIDKKPAWLSHFCVFCLLQSVESKQSNTPTLFFSVIYGKKTAWLSRFLMIIPLGERVGEQGLELEQKHCDICEQPFEEGDFLCRWAAMGAFNVTRTCVAHEVCRRNMQLLVDVSDEPKSEPAVPVSKLREVFNLYNTRLFPQCFQPTDNPMLAYEYAKGSIEGLIYLAEQSQQG
jgi:hypothetical protein